MEALLLLGILISIAGMIASVFKINAYAEATYHYKPISIANFMAVLPAYALAIAGLMFTESSDPMNSIIMYVACAAYVVFQLHRLTNHTSLAVALYSFVLMAIGWLPILIFLFLRMNPGQDKRSE